MSQLRVESFTISLDGFGAGPDQSLDSPLGIGGESLHGWALGTRTFQRVLFGKDEGATGIDDDFAARGHKNIGAWILGRNMFDAFPADPESESYQLLKGSFDRVLQTGEVDEIALIRYDIENADGSMDVRYWSATHTPLPGPTGIRVEPGTAQGAAATQGNASYIFQHTVDVTELQSLRRLRDEMSVVQRASAIQERSRQATEEAGGGPGRTCTHCHLNVANKVSKELPCRSYPCPVAHLMHPEIEIYLAMFRTAYSDFYQGERRALLLDAGASNRDLEVMAWLSGVVAKWNKKK